jgi:hypothetical protein
MKAAMTAQMTTTISVLNVANTYHTLYMAFQNQVASLVQLTTYSL